MDVELDTEIFNHNEVYEEINMFKEVFEELYTTVFLVKLFKG